MYNDHKAPRKMSRRAVLGTAGVGALGAAGVGFGVWQAVDNQQTEESAEAITASGTSATGMISASTSNNPIVAFLENPEGTTVQFFVGTDRIVVQDAGLVKALKTAAAAQK
jgi:hypothetical protein